jgi:hypothetical protein
MLTNQFISATAIFTALRIEDQLIIAFTVVIKDLLHIAIGA